MIKKYINVVLFLFLAFAVGCATKSNMQPEGEWTLSEAELVSPDADATIELDEIFTTESIDFEWKPSVNSADYIIKYAVVLVSDTATSYENPLIEVESNNNGKDITASITHEEIDLALAQACYPKDQVAKVKWGVKAMSLSVVAFSSQPINIKRFSFDPIPNNLYLIGTATEVGNNLAQGIPLKAFKDAEGKMTFFETITQLTKDETYEFVSRLEEPALHYGGENGSIALCGAEITATEDGVFRVGVDLVSNTIKLEKINHLGIVGTPIEGEWSGDVALPYLGNGLFQDTVELLQTGGFVLRIDGDWGRMYKQTPGTTSLLFEPYADAVGLAKEDLQNENVGNYIVSADFLGTSYSYSFEKVEVDIPTPNPIVAPESLFLIPNDGSGAVELVKDNNVFTSNYLALQAAVKYTLNSAADGSGTSYSLLGNIGETEDDPNGDNVYGAPYFKEEAGDISVIRDQAYMLTIDFDAPTVQWQYYNIKLFHWDDNGGWDDRKELPMTYVHPYTFTLENTDLSAGFDSKFFSPWDVEFGVSDAAGSTDDATATTGTTTNKTFVEEGVNVSNFKFTSTDGTYTVSLEITNDYTVGNYTVTQ
ncbi:hypothetical protein EI427_22840 [Flammeovirga pectinis]|uniref:SusE outer membrane protein domain-containing protein n=1 Tax=Flammeovirga pectinis TaxID=2494373 RepID=A0A3S9PA31_9BACT|nr:SusE domain-containing protein [Flammeovirga pectinis]AZQ65060.1 hypothetical protein EI427_22840 [Flammeovirga pectinis]